MLQQSFRRPAAALAAALAVAAVAAQPAFARTSTSLEPPGSRAGQPAAVAPDAARTDASPIVRSIDEGFDWGAAAIGAGAGAMIVLVSVGGPTLATRRQVRVTR